MGANFLARRNCKGKGPEARAYLMCSVNSNETRVRNKNGKVRVVGEDREEL